MQLTGKSLETLPHTYRQITIRNRRGLPEYREVLIMSDVRGMSIAETAAATGLNEGLVKVRLFRARLTMQKLLVPQLAPKQRGLIGWLTRKASECLHSRLQELMDADGG